MGAADRIRRAVAALLLVASGLGSAASGSLHTVTMEGIRFDPPSLTVTPGDTVVWINKDPFPHTVSAQSGGFDSGNIGPGKTWRYTAKRVGAFPYGCKLHPTMMGVLQVEKPDPEKRR